MGSGQQLPLPPQDDRFMTQLTRTEVIKKFRLKKGCKYILIFPESSGLTADDIARIPKIPELAGLSFRVKSARGIKVIEQESTK
jgi:hypothetical protein